MSIWIEHPSIPELTEAFLAGRLSPVDAVDEALATTARLNPVLGIMVQTAEDTARRAAEASAARYREGRPLSPVDGVPVTVKDLMDVAGLPTRYGTAWDNPPPPAKVDASPVARLRAAGAVIVGKTRLLEFAYGIANPEDGFCRNPWDLGRTSGGSSSGAAAGVAAGIGYGAVGTDTGGSIRIPAAYCGVFGFKPTKGTIPTTGVFPLSWTLDHVGPIARHSADLTPLWATLANRRLEPVACPERPRLGVVAGWGMDPVTPGVRQALTRAWERFGGAGATLVPVAIPALEDAEAILMTIVMAEATAVHEAFSDRTRVRYAPLTRAQLDAGRSVLAADYLRALMHRRQLAAVVSDTFDAADLDALVMPTVGFVAPASDPVFGDGDDGSREAWFTGPWNVTGHPAVSVPLPELVDGLPVGFQMVGRRGDDLRLLKLAEWAQEALGFVIQRPRAVNA
jgi:aspartyl-tRNA(Asn)/glutamyl-tRNA(Gln) amidotransferase subunit A